jgi:hypothetical protein
VPDRQYVVTVPRLVRHFFARRREWVGELRRIAERLLSRAYAEALPGGKPALIVAAGDAEGRKKLAGYMLRAPMSLLMRSPESPAHPLPALRLGDARSRPD